MNTPRFCWLSLGFVLLLVVLAPAAHAEPGKAEVNRALGGAQIPFIENQGQAEAQVAFYAQTYAGTTFVTRNGELVYALPGKPKARSQEKGIHAYREMPERGPGWTLVETLVNAHLRPQPGIASETKVSRFFGTDPLRWQPQLSTYQSLKLGEAWPGITVELHAHGGTVEKLFTVAPGAQVARIQLHLKGAEQIAVTSSGALAITTGLGTVELTAPIGWQEREGKRQSVPVAYTLRGNTYGFTLGPHDPTLPVIIDPVLQSTYLGGNGTDLADSLAVTTSEVYVAGSTTSTNFPGTKGGVQTVMTGGDAFVTRLNLALTSITQSTYLGGSNVDRAYALRVTASEVYVTGSTTSSDFPGTSGGAQPAPGGLENAFVARLNLGLTALTQATYLGGIDNDTALALVVTASDVYVAGNTESTNFPGTEGGAQETLGDGRIVAFVARLNRGLTALIQSTYLGGGEDGAFALVVTASDVYVTGLTRASDFPGTIGGAQPTIRGFENAFVARLNLGLTSLIQSTYLGGNEDATAYALAVTASGVYVAGQAGEDLPGTRGGAQENGSGAFATRFNLNLTELIQSTYLGGARALALVVTGSDLYVAGESGEAFVVRLNLGLTTLFQSMSLGGGGDDVASALVVTASDVYIAGDTASADFPGTTGGAQEFYGGGMTEAFVARLSLDLQAPTLRINDVTKSEGHTGMIAFTFTVTLTGASNLTHTVEWSTANATALAGSDYTAASGTLTFPPSSAANQTRTLTVGVRGDTLVEPSETFFVNLTNPSNATILDGRGVGRIQNDDTAALRINNVNKAEGNSGSSAFTFLVTLSNPSATTVTATYATANGSAVAGSDYTPLPVTQLAFSPGQTSKAVVVNVRGDTDVEPNETFVVNVSNARGATILDGQGIGTILNDEGPVLRISDVSKAEGNKRASIFTFTVTLTPASPTLVRVNCATANGSATAISDYKPLPVTQITFSPGQTRKAVGVYVRGDKIPEPDETFVVNVSSASGATIFDGQGIGTILNDERPVLRIHEQSRREQEGEQSDLP